MIDRILNTAQRLTDMLDSVARTLRRERCLRRRRRRHVTRNVVHCSLIRHSTTLSMYDSVHAVSLHCIWELSRLLRSWKFVGMNCWRRLLTHCSSKTQDGDTWTLTTEDKRKLSRLPSLHSRLFYMAQWKEKRGRPPKSWIDNITDWTCKNFVEARRLAHDCLDRHNGKNS